MKACKILLLVIALLIAGCQNQVTEEKKTDTETITSTLSEWDTYTNNDILSNCDIIKCPFNTC